MSELYETVFEHEKGRDTFTVTAAERWSINMVHRLKARFPDEVSIRATNADGSMVVHLPFSGMRIIPKRRAGTETAERLKKCHWSGRNEACF